MSKTCVNPNCPEFGTIYDDGDEICGGCGGRLVDKPSTEFHLGDANAISGGVNINKSTNVSSHDTHYHSTTVNERAKSDLEIKLDANNQLRSKAEEIMLNRGRIDSVAVGQLRPIARKLGIPEETFKNIIREIRSSRNGLVSGLSAANSRYLLLSQQAIKTNDLESLSNLTQRLEAMAAISLDDDVQYLYHLTLSMLYPIKSIEIYEKQTDENYWRTFWAIVSYIRTGKYQEATVLLAKFDPIRYEKSGDDQNLLEAYFNFMKGDNDEAQEFLDEILNDVTSQIIPLHRAIELKIYGEEADSLEIRFYVERVLVKSDVVITPKKVENNVTDVVNSCDAPNDTRENNAKNVKNDIDLAQEIYDKALLLTGKERFDEFMKAAQKGLAQAQFDVADALSEGGDKYGCTKNIFESVKWLEKAAAQNHPTALTCLGQMYLNATGDESIDKAVERNYERGEKYLLAAAALNEKYAMLWLANLYRQAYSGNDPEKPEESFKWAMKCATVHNDENAALMLGYMFLNGYGADENIKLALNWFEQAAEGGNTEAMNVAGNIYQNCDKIENDYSKAFSFYIKSAQAGDAEGMWNLAFSYNNGIGCEKDQSEANKWLKMSAKLGNENAIELLKNNENGKNDSCSAQHLLNEAERAINEKNYALAYRKLLEAQNLGDTSASSRIQELYQKGKDYSKDKNFKEAVEILAPFAEAGHADSKFTYAQILTDGYNDGDKNKFVNAVKGLEIYRDLANSGNLVAMTNVGWCYEFGHGADTDAIEATKWYKLAIDNGYEVNDWLTTRMKECNDKIYLKGQKSYEDKKFKDAVEILQPLADNGHEDSQFILADIFVDGKNDGIRNDCINYKKGFDLYMSLANSGIFSAMNNLGWCYQNGRGVEKNLSQALSWYHKAIDSGCKPDEWLNSNIKYCEDNLHKNTVSIENLEIYSIKNSIGSWEHHIKINGLTINGLKDVGCKIQLYIDKLPSWYHFLGNFDVTPVYDSAVFKPIDLYYLADKETIPQLEYEKVPYNYVLSIVNGNNIYYQTKGTYYVQRIAHKFKKDEYIILNEK